MYALPSVQGKNFSAQAYKEKIEQEKKKQRNKTSLKLRPSFFSYHTPDIVYYLQTSVRADDDVFVP